jgi:hypothetical protein
MVLTVSFALSPVIGLVVTVAGEISFTDLTPTIEASGPHDFAVRKKTRSSVAPLASIASRPYVRDDRETPLCVGRDGATSAGDLPQTAMEIFLRRGLDDPNQLETKGEFLLCDVAVDLILRSGLLAASRRMDAIHGLASILRDARKRALLRMRAEHDAASSTFVAPRYAMAHPVSDLSRANSMLDSRFQKDNDRYHFDLGGNVRTCFRS